MLRRAPQGDSTASCQPGAAAPAWRQQRFWFTAPAHALLHSALARTSAAGLEVAMQTSVVRGALAYLCDHQIQVRRQKTRPIAPS